MSWVERQYFRTSRLLAFWKTIAIAEAIVLTILLGSHHV